MRDLPRPSTKCTDCDEIDTLTTTRGFKCFSHFRADEHRVVEIFDGVECFVDVVEDCDSGHISGMRIVITRVPSGK